jgi:hypothetical protein
MIPVSYIRFVLRLILTEISDDQLGARPASKDTEAGAGVPFKDFGVCLISTNLAPTAVFRIFSGMKS